MTKHSVELTLREAAAIIRCMSLAGPREFRGEDRYSIEERFLDLFGKPFVVTCTADDATAATPHARCR